jgi:hypothetical protein
MRILALYFGEDYDQDGVREVIELGCSMYFIWSMGLPRKESFGKEREIFFPFLRQQKLLETGVVFRMSRPLLIPISYCGGINLRNLLAFGINIAQLHLPNFSSTASFERTYYSFLQEIHCLPYSL